MQKYCAPKCRENYILDEDDKYCILEADCIDYNRFV